MNRLTVLSAVISLCVITAMGCSGGKFDPVTPTNDLAGNAVVNPVQTHLWGYYDVYIDIPTQTATAVPNRGAMFAANVVQFVNSPVSNLSFAIKGTPAGTGFVDVDIDVSIKHPFSGLTMYNGYDVRGIFIGNATTALKYNTKLKYAVHKGTADQEMYDYALTSPDPGVYGNPDGYTRWFNPPEFGTTGLFGYTKGAVASGGYTGTATLNPFKYFADGLTAANNAYTFMTTTTGKGVFSAGTTNTRNYYLRFPTAAGIKFNYAIVANWIDETTHPANAPEACAISASVVPDIYYVSGTDKGGKLKVNFRLPLQWGVAPSTVYLESTVLSTPYQLAVSEMIPTGGDATYSVYHAEVTADNITGDSAAVTHEYWIIAQYDDYNYKNTFGVTNLAGEDKLAAFFRSDLYVSPIAYNKPPVCDLDVTGPLTGYDEVNCVFDATGTTDPDPGDVLTYSWDFNGNGVYGETPADSYTGSPNNPTHKYTADYIGNVNLRVTDSKSAISDCQVAVNIDVKPTTIYLYDGATDNGSMTQLGSGGGANWTYVSASKVWDENGNVTGSTDSTCRTLATPTMNIPTGVSSIRIELTHSGVMDNWYGSYATAGGRIGYTTNGGTSVNYNNVPCTGSTSWLTLVSGTDFQTPVPYYTVYFYGWEPPGCWPCNMVTTEWQNRMFGGTFGSLASPVTSTWSLNGLMGQNNVQFCFLYASDQPMFGPEGGTGWQLAKLKVYLVP